MFMRIVRFARSTKLVETSGQQVSTGVRQ